MASHKKANKKQADQRAQQDRLLSEVKKDLRKGNAEKHLSLAEQLHAILVVHQAVVAVHGADSKIANNLLVFASSFERTIDAQRLVAEAKAKQSR